MADKSKVIVATVLTLLVAAITSTSSAAAAEQPAVGCYNVKKQRVIEKGKPPQCTLVVAHQCGGFCAADQIGLDNCDWNRWKQDRAGGRCTWRGNMGFHKRVSVGLRRVRGGRFTRAEIGGRLVRIWYSVNLPGPR